MATQLQKPKTNNQSIVKLIHTIEDILNVSNLLLLLIPALGITSYFTIGKEHQGLIHTLLTICFALVAAVKIRMWLLRRFNKFHHLFGIISLVTNQKLNRIIITDDSIESLDDQTVYFYRPADSPEDKDKLAYMVRDSNSTSPIYYSSQLKNISTVCKNASYLIFNSHGNLIASFSVLPTVNGHHMNSPDLSPSMSCISSGKSHTILLHDLTFNADNLGMTEVSYTLTLLCQKIAEIACTNDESYQDIIIYAKARQDDYVFNKILIKMGFAKVVNENHPESIVTYKLDFVHDWHNPYILKIYELMRK